ncbi:hypothetical protein PG997_000681 [Apiospora hydei]|uniref:Uncharacterized protein n=1 Tax=Apiospora hydei TaxID=1337664 RepID=A0ABR1XBA4_9PEZI
MVWFRLTFMYICVCFSLAGYTTVRWNEHKHYSIPTRLWTAQWQGFFFLFIFTMPIIPVLWGFQLFVNACLHYGGTPSSNPSASTRTVQDDLEGQQSPDDGIYTTEGRGVIHKALVKFVGLPPLRAGVPSWAEQNSKRCDELRANENMPLLAH